MDSPIKFLRVASIIFKVLAWVSVVFFVVVTLIVLVNPEGTGTPRVASIVFLLGGALYFLFLFTMAEIIKVLVSISLKVKEPDAASDVNIDEKLKKINAKVERLLSLLEGKPGA